MKQLSWEGFARARHFLKTEARALDRALFEFCFEEAPAEAVARALSAYQNPDGGFGHALEPDVRTPDSSALATGIGLQMLKEIACPADHPMVEDAVHYLLDTFNSDGHIWRIVPHSANDYPHAPWWHDEDGSLARTFDQFFIIPRAQLVGLLHHFSAALPGAAVPTDWLDAVTERIVADIETIDVLGSGGGDDLAYTLGLAAERGLATHPRERILARVRREVPRAVSRDPAEWHTYCMRPLKVVHTPDSPIADLIWDAAQADLDYQIGQQSPAGTWDPVWNWSGNYPEAWEQARHEWRGHITLETLTILRAFGRIENI
ncbi:MAG: hypothetical protein JXA93_24175 [Anaerolineae bacterium]|nr:hypothetical protein [Anaerolineae bacterium]